MSTPSVNTPDTPAVKDRRVSVGCHELTRKRSPCPPRARHVTDHAGLMRSQSDNRSHSLSPNKLVSWPQRPRPLDSQADSMYQSRCSQWCSQANGRDQTVADFGRLLDARDLVFRDHRDQGGQPRRFS